MSGRSNTETNFGSYKLQFDRRIAEHCHVMIGKSTACDLATEHACREVNVTTDIFKDSQFFSLSDRVMKRAPSLVRS